MRDSWLFAAQDFTPSFLPLAHLIPPGQLKRPSFCIICHTFLSIIAICNLDIFQQHALDSPVRPSPRLSSLLKLFLKKITTHWNICISRVTVTTLVQVFRNLPKVLGWLHFFLTSPFLTLPKVAVDPIHLSSTCVAWALLRDLLAPAHVGIHGNEEAAAVVHQACTVLISYTLLLTLDWFSTACAHNFQE